MSGPIQSTGQSVVTLEEMLSQKLDKLSELVENDDLASVKGLIEEMKADRDEALYSEVASLTKAVHVSAHRFHCDADKQESEMQPNELHDASDRLEYIVDMTSKAANTTIDLVDKTVPCANNMRSQAQLLGAEWERLRRKEMSPEEFRAFSAQMTQFFQTLQTDADAIHQNLSDIVVAQEYQDLTGQVINNVGSTIGSIENDFAELERLATHVDSITGTEHEFEEKKTDMKGEGPQIKAAEDVVSGQDDVDDLLASLGI